MHDGSTDDRKHAKHYDEYGLGTSLHFGIIWSSKFQDQEACLMFDFFGYIIQKEISPLLSLIIVCGLIIQWQ